jgi:hypothetical protein
MRRTNERCPMKNKPVREPSGQLVPRAKRLFIVVASVTMAIAASGCSLSTQASAGSPDSQESVLYPKKQLCRIGRARSSGRYVALITQTCAADPGQLGLKSSYLRVDLESLGAN